jgi:hypothetical protein
MDRRERARKSTVAFVSFLGYEVYGLTLGHFSIGEFGNGLMTVLPGSGGLIMGKQFTQKSQAQPLLPYSTRRQALLYATRRALCFPVPGVSDMIPG